MQDEIQSLYRMRAERVAWLISMVPFIRMVGLNGSVARGEAKETSDIDYLIITKPGRLFLTRLLVSFLVTILAIRRHGNLIAGRICLNRYQSTNFLEIQPNNTYHAQVFSSLVPLISIEDTYKRYQVANQWMNNFSVEVAPAYIPEAPIEFLQNELRIVCEWILGGRIGDWIEKLAKLYQINKIKRNPLTTKYPDKIRFSDDELLFHPPAAGEVDSDLDRWDSAAASYDFAQGRIGDPLRRLVMDPAILDCVDDLANKKILDAGCGNGYLTHLLSHKGADAIGIDGSKVLIARAQQNFPNNKFEVVDLTQPTKFQDSYFDVVIASMLVQDIKDPAIFFGETFRLLKPGGKFIISIPHPAFSYPTTRARNGFGKLFGFKPKLIVQQYQKNISAEAVVPGSNVATKRYHRPLEWYVKKLSDAGFALVDLKEPVVSNEVAKKLAKLSPAFAWLDTIPFVVIFSWQKPGIIPEKTLDNSHKHE